MLRREDLRLTTGQGRYTADWNLPGQLHGFFLRADRAHAEIGGLDLVVRAVEAAIRADAEVRAHAIMLSIH